MERPNDGCDETPADKDDEIPKNENDEHPINGDDGRLGAQRQGPKMYEYGEDWESVTFVGDDEAQDFEVDDDNPGDW